MDFMWRGDVHLPIQIAGEQIADSPMQRLSRSIGKGVEQKVVVQLARDDELTWRELAARGSRRSLAKWATFPRFSERIKLGGSCRYA